MGWMAWTLPTAIFFGVIAALLAGMTAWEIASPGVPRRGALPLVTTRGDRLFIGLLLGAFFNLAWVGLTDIDQWWALGLTMILVGLVGRFG